MAKKKKSDPKLKKHVNDFTKTLETYLHSALHLAHAYHPKGVKRIHKHVMKIAKHADKMAESA